MTLTDKYAQIDKVLDDWLPKYGLTVYKEFKDELVRTISVIDNSGNKYDLWLTPDPNTNNKIEISVNDPSQGKHGQSWRSVTDWNNLTNTLDKAYKTIDNWINAKGHKRTWY